jgi:5'(3')-deoxyribonucleotidase
MKQILYIDMDGVLVDFQSGIDKLTEQEKIEYFGRYDEAPNIFSKMDPMVGAIHSYRILSEYFDTFILTTSPWENETALGDKLKWIKNHLGDYAYKRMISSHHKHLNMGHFLVDDRIANGAANFMGEHIHFGTDKFPNWQAVLEYLMRVANAK